MAGDAPLPPCSTGQWIPTQPPRCSARCQPRSASASSRLVTSRDEADALRGWQRALHRGGWVGIHWPVEHGGRGASPAMVAVYNEELARAGAPDIPGRAGVTLVGPTLIAHGTEEQRRRWMPRILAGDDIWCQLFSEPGAGSDLAGLSTRAERHGDV